MLRLGIISNPFAKMNKNNPEHNTQMWYTLANDGHYEVTHSLSELEKVCQEFCERNINLVGILGGDGSIGLVLSCLLKAYGCEKNLPKILVLKGGTINFLASNLGMDTSALTCLTDTLFLLKKNLHLFEISLRTIEINGRLGFIFAGGLAPAFLEEFYKNKTNSFGAALSLSKYVIDGLCAGKINGSFKNLVKPQLLNVVTKPEPLWQKSSPKSNQQAYTLIFASTVPKLPLNINLFKKISLHTQSAEMVAITENGTKLINGMLNTLVGKTIHHFKGVDSVLFTQATIQTPSKLELPYSLDGDLFLAKEGYIDIKYGPSFIFCSPYYIADNVSIPKGS